MSQILIYDREKDAVLFSPLDTRKHIRSQIRSIYIQVIADTINDFIPKIIKDEFVPEYMARTH